MVFHNLRDFMGEMEQYGELKTLNGVGWDLDMSSIAEVVFTQGKDPKPMLVFDDVPGYEKGYRTLFSLLGSPRRVAKTLNVAEDADRWSLLNNWRRKSRDIKLVPHKFVNSGPVQENLMTGDKIDLWKFPIPRFHELDGGRYIGTCHAVVQKDPDSGWVNLGTYRVMVVDRNHVTIHALEAKHGSTIMTTKYFEKRRVMPIAIAIGIDPTLWFASTYPTVPFGVSEYDYAGGVKGEPVEVIEGPYSGIPVPAYAEIVIEGECHPGEVADEGPFGEWCGYYANLGREPVPEPLIRVKAIHYRDNPILTCAHMHVPPCEITLIRAVTMSVAIWNLLESMETPGIRGVWTHESGAGRLFNVISLKQLYAGHAQRTGLIASQVPKDAGGYTVVVDDDIDPLNLEEVVWAMATRVDPERSIQILPYCRTGSADARVPIAEKKKYQTTPKPLMASRIVVNACQPYEHKSEWYPVSRMSPELRQKTIEKWGAILEKLI
ncbi:UbiD family decarboxylase [Chloroflexota bacterium]